MKTPFTLGSTIPLFLITLLLLSWSIPATAQHDDHDMAVDGVRAEAIQAIGVVGEKASGLAEALSAEQYAWRPAEDVRSISEVLMHLAGTNYWLPTLLGFTPPEDVSVTGEYQTAAAFEKITDRDEIIASVAASFAYLKETLAQVPAERMDEPMEFFGTSSTVRGYCLAIATHMHEHLGQLIAYARMNDVTPPWSM